PETRNTTLNMLNVHAAPSAMAGINVGAIMGKVTKRSRLRRDAPSSSAASMTSGGTPVSAAIATTIMKGNPSHTLVATLAENAVENRANQARGSKPKRSSRALIDPNCLWNIPFHASAVTYDGTAQGTMRSTR